MGYIRHKALLVQGYTSEQFNDIRRCHRDIEVLYGTSTFTNGDNFSGLVTPLMEHLTNGEATFMIAPDGSKEGWETSNNGDVLLDQAKAIVDQYGCHYAVVIMGGDDAEYYVAEHNGPEQDED